MKVHAEATLVFPMIVAATFARRSLPNITPEQLIDPCK
jgi:deoxyhypusine synthase